MIGVTPYIAFSGNCEEAIDFYKQNLNAEVLYIGRWGDSPMAGECGMPDDKIMHTTIKIGETHVMACDSMSSEETAAPASNISLAVGASEAAVIEEMFNKMAVGGTVTMPLQQTFWAESFGMLTDKFGVNWMFNCESAKASA